MLEKCIENRLVKGVKSYGGIAFKFVSPGNIGVPDRIIVWPDGAVHFVELKTETGKLSKLQISQIRRLTELKQLVYTLYGKEAVDEYLEQAGAIHGEELR